MALAASVCTAALIGPHGVRSALADQVAVQTANPGLTLPWTGFAGAISAGTAGWAFQVGANNATVTSLGLYAPAAGGLTQSHEVGIWTNTGTLLTSITVPSGAAPQQIGAYRYEPIAPLVLTAGQTYVIGAFYPGASTETVTAFSTQSYAPDVTFVQSRQTVLSVGATFAFPNVNASVDQGVFGPNFIFSGAQSFTATASGTWNDFALWTPTGFPNGNDNVANLVLPASGTNTVDLGGGTFTVNQLNATGSGAGGWSVVNGTLILDGATPTVSNASTASGVSQTIAANLQLQLNQTTTFQITNAGAATQVSGTISGNGGLIKTGLGTLILGGTNSYQGGTFLNGGSVSVSADTNLGAAAGGLTFDGGTLQVTGTSFTSTPRAITWGAGGGGFDIAAAANTFTVSQALHGVGGLNKLGAGTLVLSGSSDYSGPTNVNGGTLEVDGSIASSSLTTVNSGAVLDGTGTVGKLTIANGGAFAPGLIGPGSMTVAGNLAFASGALYVVQVTPASASQANVTVGGTASLGGTVLATFANGSYVARSYDILHAASVGNTFASLNTLGLPAGFTASLSYTPTDVFLNLTAVLGQGPGALPTGGLSGNQQHVGNALNTFFNNGGTLPPGFLTVFGLTGAPLGNALTQLSGETATGASTSSFQLMTDFMGLLLDPTAQGRGGGFGPVPFAPDRAQAFPPDVAEAYASVLKAPPARAYGRFNVWGAAYGGSNNTSGDPAVIGSHDMTARAGGFAGGVDYRVAPDLMLGAALAGGGTSWGLSAGLGSGKSDAFQAGLYGSKQFGAAYLSGALAFANYWASTTRTVTVAGADTLNASFNAQSVGGRLEAGYRLAAWAPVTFTPYAALQAQNFRTPTYSETAASGSPQFALTYASNTATAVRTELGSWVSKSILLADANVLALFGRAAWAHDRDSNLALTPTFLALPAASFVVNGAAPPQNLALLTTGAELRLVNGWSAMAKFDGELARGSRTYSGTARLRYAW